jgi:hypothetical protein
MRDSKSHFVPRHTPQGTTYQPVTAPSKAPRLAVTSATRAELKVTCDAGVGGWGGVRAENTCGMPCLAGKEFGATSMAQYGTVRRRTGVSRHRAVQPVHACIVGSHARFGMGRVFPGLLWVFERPRALTRGHLGPFGYRASQQPKYFVNDYYNGSIIGSAVQTREHPRDPR